MRRIIDDFVNSLSDAELKDIVDEIVVFHWHTGIIESDSKVRKIYRQILKEISESISLDYVCKEIMFSAAIRATRQY